MSYEVLIPSIPVLSGYLVTYILYRKGLIKKAFHVNIWNFIIMLTFLISGGAGFLLLILLELKVALPVKPQLLYWHVELGITLALVTLFHIHTYWKTSMFHTPKRRSRS